VVVFVQTNRTKMLFPFNMSWARLRQWAPAAALYPQPPCFESREQDLAGRADCHHLSRFEIASDKRIYQHLIAERARWL
jgi:hypothetical protein